MSRRRLSNALVAGAFALASVQATAAVANGKPPAAPAAPAETCRGAAAMEHRSCAKPYTGPVTPAPEEAAEDFAISYEQDCVAGLPWDADQYRACTYFSKRKDNTAHVALVGQLARHPLPARRCWSWPARTTGSSRPTSPASASRPPSSWR